ncbi:hypothetical protein OS493_032827 [Desmophyllum pertusum]|uniref:Uncharacterized protein n=1 Tax=Desmophyllum pertusum TaxID=174260 RepID=A0A9W9YZ89_9CNID|nr:hypothetical protein OS493_032827 [Desmophyllum pertusum]
MPRKKSREYYGLNHNRVAHIIKEIGLPENSNLPPGLKDGSYWHTIKAQERVAGMRDYLLSIANTPFSEELPPPHLERHQTYLLFGGFLYSFKKLETMLLGTECFPFPVIDKILHFVHDLFQSETKPSIKRQTGSKIKFEPLIKETSFLDYDLPKTIPGHISYVSHVLWHEAITKLVMDLQGCDYLEATGIALGEEKPTRTPYGLKWESLVEEAKAEEYQPYHIQKEAGDAQEGLQKEISHAKLNANYMFLPVVHREWFRKHRSTAVIQLKREKWGFG